MTVLMRTAERTFLDRLRHAGISPTDSEELRLQKSLLIFATGLISCASMVWLLIYKGEVDKSLGAYIAWADKQVANLNGAPPPPGDPSVPLIADDADLSTLPLAPIAAEMARLEALFSADKLVRDQYTACLLYTSKTRR